jgi:hypothetical protein
MKNTDVPGFPEMTYCDVPGCGVKTHAPETRGWGRLPSRHGSVIDLCHHHSVIAADAFTKPISDARDLGRTQRPLATKPSHALRLVKPTQE